MKSHEQSVWMECQSAGAALTGLVTDPSGGKVDGPLLLWTISGLESSHGAFRQFVRYEEPFAPGGRYYSALADQWKKWGALAASSFGSFQIMYQVARELGFTGDPIKLQEDAVCAEWAAALITKRIVGRQGAQTVRDVLDAYNSGTHRDLAIPTTYVRNGLLLYQQGRPQ